jgi:hypothetical protein
MQCYFSKYKNMFGIPKQGGHSYRIFDIAIIDVIATIIVGIAIAYFGHFELWKVLAVLFLAGIIMHRLFCVRTTVDKWLFP